MTQDDINKNVDVVLKEIFTDTTSTNEAAIKYKFNHFTEIDELIQVMAVLGIIELTDKANRGNRIILLTNYGHEVLRGGGWTNYLDNKKEEKRLSTELISSSIRTNNLQKILLWLTAIFSILTFVISTIDYLAHNEEQEIQRQMLRLQGGGQHLQQNTKTVDLNQDSSKISNRDSLQKQVKR